MYRKLCIENYVQKTMYRKLCIENYVQKTMYRKLCIENYLQKTISESFKKQYFMFKLILAIPYQKVIESNFLIPISSQPDTVNLLYFKLKLFDLTEFIV